MHGDFGRANITVGFKVTLRLFLTFSSHEIYANKILYQVIYANKILYQVIYANKILHQVIYANKILYQVIYANKISYQVIYANKATRLIILRCRHSAQDLLASCIPLLDKVKGSPEFFEHETSPSLHFKVRKDAIIARLLYTGATIRLTC